MDRSELLDRLRASIDDIVEDPVDWATVDESTALAELGLDSLALLDVLYAFERALDIEIDAEELDDAGTVGELLTALSRLLGG